LKVVQIDDIPCHLNYISSSGVLKNISLFISTCMVLKEWEPGYNVNDQLINGILLLINGILLLINGVVIYNGN